MLVKMVKSSTNSQFVRLSESEFMSTDGLRRRMMDTLSDYVETLQHLGKSSGYIEYHYTINARYMSKYTWLCFIVYAPNIQIATRLASRRFLELIPYGERSLRKIQLVDTSCK
jgi:hypothetical protein